MSHYAKIRDLGDVSSLRILHKCAQDPNITLMSAITDGVYFDMEIGYCVLTTDHFCSYCQAKTVKHIPEHLLACYCTYDESSDDHKSLVAEVCFCPSNSECRKVTHYFNYHYTMEPVYCGHLGTSQKCSDYQGVLIFQVSLHDNVSFGTTARCVDYAGVLIFKCPD